MERPVIDIGGNGIHNDAIFHNRVRSHSLLLVSDIVLGRRLHACVLMAPDGILMASPDRKGSGEKPSQLRPPIGWRPKGPEVGLATGQ